MTCVKPPFQPVFAIFFREYRVACMLTAEGYFLYLVLSAAKMCSVRIELNYPLILILDISKIGSWTSFWCLLQVFSKMIYGNTYVVSITIFLGCLNADYTALGRYICLKNAFLFPKEGEAWPSY